MAGVVATRAGRVWWWPRAGQALAVAPGSVAFWCECQGFSSVGGGDGPHPVGAGFTILISDQNMSIRPYSIRPIKNLPRLDVTHSSIV